jgi:hypothetical protein
MRSSLALPSSLALQIGLFAASLNGAFASAAVAADGHLAHPVGIVGGLTVLGDLEPLAANERSTTVGTGASATVAKWQSIDQQSLPRDRAPANRTAVLFVLSKSAVPLLVADLEPRSASVAQPMKGRSVGVKASSAMLRVISVPSSSVAGGDASGPRPWRP